MSRRETRVVLAGAGAAGIGIARLIRLAMLDEGMDEATIRNALVRVDSRGQVHDRREDLDATKRELALPAEAYGAYGFSTEFPGLVETIDRVRPTVLVGTTGVGGTFDEAVLRAMAAATERPIVLPLSNPTSASEAAPIDILRWTDGRAVVATGSPFEAVDVNGKRREVGQANNVFVFPGVGLGAIAAEATTITDRMFLLAARTLAAAVTGDRLATGAIYPPVGDLRAVTRAIALEVAGEAARSGVAGIPPDADLVATVDGAMWWPASVPYLAARPTERRRSGET
jgi:malic enzyme